VNNIVIFSLKNIVSTYMTFVVFWSWDVLWLGRFGAWDDIRLGTFRIWNVLGLGRFGSCDVL
jgi:hypothetical protein